ncbi:MULTISPECIES: tyrosine-protein phosphatase [Clostridium]|uniref:Tyrosine-protein phosphatase n=1 Tax=Clostridium cibarium TaxID=2762247 RepID=A0ABR8PU59_9CLOT|nr:MULTISPECIES: tyrosine-protein phosphatase [Clostridium]MBD7911663.1 tyrosine-protein phosphatase [Clostridium cibarium]
MKYFKSIRILRLTEKELKITWEDENVNNVSIFALVGNTEIFLTKVNGVNEVKITDPDVERRNLFILRAEGYHHEVVGEILLPFEGIHHFRDIGGYKSEDGRRVKWNTFYRSDKLSSLTASDIRYIKNLNIKTILDFRSLREVRESPDIAIKGIEYINLSAMSVMDKIEDDFDMMSIFSNDIASEEIEKILVKGYSSMCFNNPAFRELVYCLENEKRLPIVFHCSAGKDRTGFAAALILSILGVPEETIMDDYLKTNFYRKEINKKIISKIQERIINKDRIKLLKYMLEVKRELLEASFESIRNRYGNIDNYLEKEYGLTRKKRKELKNRLLY